MKHHSIYADNVIPSLDSAVNIAQLEQYLAWVRKQYPYLSTLMADLNLVAPKELAEKISALQLCDEFSETGRGRQWATTVDTNLTVRWSGPNLILSTLSHLAEKTSGTPYFLLDVFGGSGFIAQFAKEIFSFRGTVITSDSSLLMVRRALEKNLPALWQRAQDLLLLRDNTMDAVLFAYGTHHIPLEERACSFAEAWRVLKPGGVLLFHDFEEGSPTMHWFEEIVDKYTTTGHKHTHFTIDGLSNYYTIAGFEVQSISEIDDCFQFTASTMESTIKKASDYMRNVYGLEKLEQSNSSTEFLWKRIEHIFSVEKCKLDPPLSLGYQVIIHRPALFSIGRKPAT